MNRLQPAAWAARRVGHWFCQATAIPRTATSGSPALNVSTVWSHRTHVPRVRMCPSTSRGRTGVVAALVALSAGGVAAIGYLLLYLDWLAACCSQPLRPRPRALRVGRTIVLLVAIVLRLTPCAQALPGRGDAKLGGDF